MRWQLSHLWLACKIQAMRVCSFNAFWERRICGNDYLPVFAMREVTKKSELIVGVTGHRLHRLANTDVVLLAHRISDLLNAIEHSAKFVGISQFRLISNFADGADRMAGDGALRLGWALDALLPFPLDDFARDFESETERINFAAQYARAKGRSHVHPARSKDDAGIAGYEAAGRAILDRCDMLLGIWDKGPSRGRGGAAQIVGEAIDRRIPVALIDPRDNGPTEAVTLAESETGAIVQRAVASLTTQ